MNDKSNKGLRHFSMKVCQKVEEKQTTTYNEVADELVKEFGAGRAGSEACAEGMPKSAYDEKNIRRRVYDALNVLMAMDIISKEKKEIRWKGLPSNATHDMEALQREKNIRLNNVRKKRIHLQELLLQHIAFKNLVKRNASRANQAEGSGEEETKIHLPFIIVNTKISTVIECQMSDTRSDIFFNFSAPFEINDDNEVLKRMKMHKAPQEELPTLIPAQLMSYLPPEVLD